MSYETERQFAANLAREAGAIMLEHFEIGVPAQLKVDGTPVTEADLAINDLAIQRIVLSFPDHAVLGEEGCRPVENAEHQWIIDPIDGSANYIFGIPINVFAATLNHRDEPQIAVVFDPYQDRMYEAQRRQGAFMNGQRLRVNRERLSESVIGLSGKTSKVVDAPLMHMQVERAAKRVRILGSVVSEGMSVAAGQFSGHIYAGSHAYDAISSSIFVREAGGVVTDLRGDDIVFDGGPINGIIASNGVVHDELLAIAHDCMLAA